MTLVKDFPHSLEPLHKVANEMEESFIVLVAIALRPSVIEWAGCSGGLLLVEEEITGETFQLLRPTALTGGKHPDDKYAAADRQRIGVVTLLPPRTLPRAPCRAQVVRRHQ